MVGRVRREWSLKWASITVLLSLSIAVNAAAQTSWQAEWEKTVEAAKAEGQLVIYGGNDYETLFAEFQKKYPAIKVTSVIATGREVAQKMMTERRAGKYLVDLYLDGASTAYSVLYKGKVIEPIKSMLILPEVIDQSKWWMGGKYNYSDDEGKYIFSYNGELQPYFAYNSKLVNVAK
jgi:ABC-type glycerol-3-phosphate transport system substrate-binding protein